MSKIIRKILMPAVVILASCSSPTKTYVDSKHDKETWQYNKMVTIGKGYQELVDCAGPPTKEESLSSEIGMIRYEFVTKGGEASCIVGFTIQAGQVVNVNNLSSYADTSRACSTAFQHCPWIKT